MKIQRTVDNVSITYDFDAASPKDLEVMTANYPNFTDYLREAVEDESQAPVFYREEVEFVIRLDDGKYEYQRMIGGGQRAFRYGEPWRDLTADNLVYFMADLIRQEQEEYTKLEERYLELAKELETARTSRDMLARDSGELVNKLGRAEAALKQCRTRKDLLAKIVLARDSRKNPQILRQGEQIAELNRKLQQVTDHNEDLTATKTRLLEDLDRLRTRVGELEAMIERGGV